MGLKLQPHVAQGQFLTGILLVFLNFTKHLVFPIVLSLTALYWSTGSISICSPDWLCFILCTSTRNAITVVYPKKRLTVQHSKHSWFSHTRQKPVTVVLSPLLWCRTFSPDGRIISFTVKIRGGLFLVLTAHPALCPTDSKRLDFSQAVEHSLNSLIASRLKEMDIWITLNKIWLHLDLISSKMNAIWCWFYTLHFKQLH